MRIAVDAMGGDYAPGEIVKGAVEAASKGSEILLVGQTARICEELQKYTYPPGSVELVEAPEVIGMDEHPAQAVRRKKNSSIVVATRLVKEKEADAVISAGSTGAQMAAALFGMGRLPGVERPAIATVFPSPVGPKVLVDSGANADTRAKHLEQFAHLGSVYAAMVLGIENPRVALLNIGSEPGKGSEAVQEVYQVLSQGELNFVGNIEGREFLTGAVDVIVCDGFVGNVALKLTEGLASTLMGMIKAELNKGVLRRLGALLVRPAFKDVFKQMDYNEYGGAPLLGVDGVSIICHGSSRARAISNAITMAGETAASGFVEKIKKGFLDNRHA